MEDKIKILDLIKATVKSQIPDAEIRLFGSQARGDSDRNSDYDILVITETTFTPGEKIPLKTSIRRELLKSGIRTDILIQSKKDIAVKRKLPGHIIRNIFRETMLL
jgi:predicted nucleotidyltransferase